MKMYVARDPNNVICLHLEKPTLRNDAIGWLSSDWMILNEDLFPEVTFENSPQEVELKLIEE
jgi:hypothetical protein